MSLKEKLLKEVENSNKLKQSSKNSKRNSIRLATEVYEINLEEVTIDEKTALAQKEIIKKKCEEKGKGKTEVSNIYGIVRDAFECVHGYELPRIDDKNFTSTSRKNIKQIKFNIDEDIEAELNDEIELYEGKKQTRTITTRQRNSDARKYVIERDNYTCQCCGLKPIELFKNTLHVHHNNPLHKSTGSRKVNFDELVTLCPTCHGYVHYKKEEITVDDVRMKLKNKS
ncbi:HNH endonuclease [Turicibacter bilis]|uniref:HNH endonuclease n=1 Tax=Turicibacter bilis TaxID=2735723 RepID=UPI001BAF87AA|nr:HNH endonuclease [Turicibacter bilis]MBS3202601.1 HNH endonuclease [Turicibacter bilis]UUF11964.1 HNH endonuclease [Turicibacter bilis]